MNAVRKVHNSWLHRFAVLTAFATLCLIGLGGLVTSHGVGMAVPDWPTTYGYNMFLFPVSKWVGGIFYEHTHRLLASAVGFLTITLTTWLWWKEPRRWLRWLGVLALFLVVLQGVLGGLRVILIKDEIGIFHAALAQLFLVVLTFIAIFTSRQWLLSGSHGESSTPSAPIRQWTVRLILALTGVMLLQLILGATMRHQHNGLAVPDFPLAYGKVWPPLDEASLQAVNQHRVDVQDYGSVTAFQIVLHMTHRLVAFSILLLASLAAWRVRRELGPNAPLSKLTLGWLVLVLAQVFLGAMTVWSNKAADVATLHVVTGALSLVLGSTATLSAFRLPRSSAQRVPQSSFALRPSSPSEVPA